MISSISALLAQYGYSQRSATTRNNPANTPSFSSTVQTVQNIHVRLPGENCIYAGGDGAGQSAYVEYADNSTEDDPIVKITGRSLSGDFNQTVHINDIDPNNATYPELCALLAHMRETGDYQQKSGLLRPVPLDVEGGDYSKRQNFSSKIQNSINHNQQYGNTSMALSGNQLLSVYEKFLDRKSKSAETQQVDLLLDYAGHMRTTQSA